MVFIARNGHMAVERKFVFAFAAAKIAMDRASRHVIFSRVDDLQLGQNPNHVNKKNGPSKRAELPGKENYFRRGYMITSRAGVDAMPMSVNNRHLVTK